MLKRNEYVFEIMIDRFFYDPETGNIHYKARSTNESSKVGITKCKNTPRTAINLRNTKYTYDQGNDYLFVYMWYQGTMYEILAHRLAWRLYYGEWPKGKLTHKNGVKYDNRIENIVKVKKEKLNV